MENATNRRQIKIEKQNIPWNSGSDGCTMGLNSVLPNKITLGRRKNNQGRNKMEYYNGDMYKYCQLCKKEVIVEHIPAEAENNVSEDLVCSECGESFYGDGE